MNVTVIVICLTVLLLGVFACISFNDWCTAKARARGPRGPMGAIGAPGAQGPMGKPAYQSLLNEVDRVSASASLNSAIDDTVLKQYRQYMGCLKSVLANLRLQGCISFVFVPDAQTKLLLSYETMALAYREEAVHRGLLGPIANAELFCRDCLVMLRNGACRCGAVGTQGEHGIKGPGPCPQGEKRPADRAPSGEVSTAFGERFLNADYAELELKVAAQIPEHALEAMHQRQARNRAANSMIVHGD